MNKKPFFRHVPALFLEGSPRFPHLSRFVFFSPPASPPPAPFPAVRFFRQTHVPARARETKWGEIGQPRGQAAPKRRTLATPTRRKCNLRMTPPRHLRSPQMTSPWHLRNPRVASPEHLCNLRMTRRPRPPLPTTCKPPAARLATPGSSYRTDPTKKTTATSGCGARGKPVGPKRYKKTNACYAPRDATLNLNKVPL